VTGQWFSPGTPVSFTNLTDGHNIAEILLKVTLNTIAQTPRVGGKTSLLEFRIMCCSEAICQPVAMSWHPKNQI